MPDKPGDRLLAIVNRNVDVLEESRANGRIDEAAYLTGRLVQAAFERLARGPGTSSWRGADRIDRVHAKDLSIIIMLENADALRRLHALILGAVGKLGEVYLARILRDGWTLRQMAAAMGQDSKAGALKAGAVFKHYLEALTEELSRSGLGIGRPTRKIFDAVD